MSLVYKRALVSAVIALALTFTTRFAFADTPPVTEAEYWALIEESRTIVAGLDNQTEEEIAQALRLLVVRWDAITVVDVEGGSIPIDNRYLTEMMRADPPDLKTLEETLASYQGARLGPPPEAFSSADLKPLAQILARPEFQWAESTSNPAADWLQKILEQANRWLNELLGITFDVATSDFIGVLMVVLLGVIFFFIFRTLFSDLLKEEQINENGEEEPLTAETALAKAQQLSRGGDYRAAVRYLYLSTLLILDERGLVRYDRSKTNREYLRGVANSPELSQPLGEVIEVFDNVWYGQHSLEEDSFQHYSRRVEELKEKRS